MVTNTKFTKFVDTALGRFEESEALRGVTKQYKKRTEELLVHACPADTYKK